MKKGPLIFIVCLIFILIFILGMQYGKKVEEANKTIRYLLSITPTKPPKPTAATRIGYSEYKHQGCGIQFLIPQELKEIKTATTTALLQNATQSLSFDCSEKAMIKNTEKIATQSVTLANQSVSTYQSNNIIKFSIPSKKTKSIVFSIDRDLMLLFQKSFAFIN